MNKIKFDTTKSFEEVKNELAGVLTNPKATEQEQGDAFNNYLEVLQTSVSSKVREQVNNDMTDREILQSRGQNVLTAEETLFFNEVIEGGFTDDSILPVTVQERVFEDLTVEHPLLSAIGLQNLGAVTTYITSDPTKAYAWGPLFGGIAGQVNAAFSEESVGQLKLTAFAAIPNDMLELGPVWIERYVRELLVESYSVGLENGFINGKGIASNEPIGLMKNIGAEGAVSDKTSSGTLTFAPSTYGEVVGGELYNVIAELSVDEAGNNRKVMNNVAMVVNPVDAIGVQARNTIQTNSGQWVTALPYNIEVIESEAVEAGKAIFFVKGQYDAILAGGYQLKKFDQTLAMEDATLYTIKQFANGKPRDNKAALVYTLNIEFTPGV